LLGRLLGKDSANELAEVRVAPSLLMEVMEWREELSNAFARRDKPEVDRIASVATARRATTVSALTAQFAALSTKTRTNAVSVTEPEVAEIAQGLTTLKYFARLAEEVRRMEDELADA
jgi:molybdopterin converting factor small subunit